MDTNTKFSMSDADHANWLALKVSVLSIAQQQRTLKRLARDESMKRTEGQNTKSTTLIDRYTWHRKVRLAREARLHHLIRAFLKGSPYEKVEHKLKEGTLDVISLSLDSSYDLMKQAGDDIGAFYSWLNSGVYPQLDLVP